VIVGLAVALWIVRGEEPVGDLILGTEARHLLARKIGPIVGDDGMKPMRHTIFCQKNLTICCPVTSESDNASPQLVK